MKHTPWIAFSLMTMSAFAQIRADHADGGATLDPGLFYTLPRTAIRVTAPVFKNSYTPGVYCKVAASFFPEAPATPTCQIKPESSAKCKDTAIDPNGFVTKACFDFSLTDTPSLGMVGLPDPDQVYRLNLEGWGKEKDFTLNLSQDSIVNKVHAQVIDRRAEIIFGFVNAAAGIVKGAFLAGAPGGAAPVKQPAPSACDEKVNPICTEAKTDFQTLQRLLAENSAFSAQANFPSNSDAYIALVKARQDRINQLISRFFGSKESGIDNDGLLEIMPFTPKAGDGAPESMDIVLFGIQQSGSCTKSTSADKYFIRFMTGAPTGSCNDGAKIIKLTLLTLTPKGETPISGVVAKSIKTGKNDQGLAYRIPRPYCAKLFSDTDEVAEQDVAIAQFGYIGHLPDKIGGDATLDFTLDGASGALLQISLNGKPKILTDLPGQLSTLGGASLDVLGAYQKAHPDASSPDPLDQATKARKLAQEQLRLLLIQQCMSQPDRPECTALVTNQ